MRASVRIGALLIAAALVSPAVAGAEEMGFPFATGEPIADSELQQVTGQADLQQISVATHSSVVSNNRINGDSVTGIINIDGQAFQNLNGLSLLNANTGNNVSMNSSLQVNVAITP